MLRLSARHTAAPLHVLAVCLIALWCTACTSGAVNHAQTLAPPEGGAHSSTQPVAGTQPGFGAVLPPPSALVEPVPEPRAASYTEDDLFRLGKNFDAALPHAAVSTPGDNVQFAPTWQPGGGTNGLAYCMYSFAAQGFDRELELNYQFTKEPAEWGTIWVGNADWAADRWVWRAADPSGRLTTLLTLESFGTDGTVLIAFVCTADGDDPALGWVYMGPPQASAKIQTFIHNGVAPVNITADASASTAGGGEITKYEWDWDGDGTFDEDSGDVPTADHTYADAGEYSPTVRVTSALGVTDLASTTMTVTAPWVHTWGGSDNDTLDDVAVGPDKCIYVCGSTNGYGMGQYDTLLLKYDLEGNLQWARTSGADSNDQLFTLSVAGDGSIYAAGRTYSAGEGNKDVLIQKWDADGNLIWSKTWGTEAYEEAKAMSLLGNALYIGGTCDYNASDGQTNQMLVAKFSLDGERIWAYTLGETHGDYVTAIQAVHPLFEDIQIYFTGYHYNSSDESAAVYGSIDDTGTLQELRTWSEGGPASIGQDLLVVLYPERHIFITGNTDSPGGGADALFVEYQDSGNPLAKAWGRGGVTESRAYGIVQTQGGLVIDCYTYGETSSLQYTDLTGTTLATKAYGAGDGNYAAVSALVSFPGQGVVAAGFGKAADIAIQDSPFDTRLLTGTWEPLGISPASVAGVGATFDATVMQISSGVIDTGAGNNDSLVLAAPQL